MIHADRFESPKADTSGFGTNANVRQLLHTGVDERRRQSANRYCPLR